MFYACTHLPLFTFPVLGPAGMAGLPAGMAGLPGMAGLQRFLTNGRIADIREFAFYD